MAGRLAPHPKVWQTRCQPGRKGGGQKAKARTRRAAFGKGDGGAALMTDKPPRLSSPRAKNFSVPPRRMGVYSRQPFNQARVNQQDNEPPRRAIPGSPLAARSPKGVPLCCPVSLAP